MYPDLSSHLNTLSSETSVHEFGHILGLYDLYDTVIDSQIFPAGATTMQDYSVAGHEPYSVMALGWANPYVFDASTMTSGNYSITIKDFASSGDVILLSPQWNASNSPFDEYILIELYTPTGLNQKHADDLKGTNFDISNAGIRIWHINASLGASNKHEYNNDSASESATDNTTKHLVHYIRNDVNSAYGKDASRCRNQTMFYEGDTFSIDKYNTQFIENGTLDNGSNLNFTVTIGEIVCDENGNASATIRLTKAI